MFKIKRFYIWWSCYKEVKYKFADCIDNDTIGQILFYVIYYLLSIVALFVFLIWSVIRYFKVIKKVENIIKINEDKNLLDKLIKQKYIKQVEG